MIPALVALAACSRAPRPAVERVAILPFLNLTDDAALDWVSRTGSAILVEELAAGARVFPLQATSAGTAALAGATRLLHCSFTQRGESIEVQYALEDMLGHKMVAAGAVQGTLLFAANALARKLDSGAQPFSTSHGDAVEAWGHGEFERAISLDPDFGTAWNSWISQAAQSGKQDIAGVLAERALARPSLRSPLVKAQIQLSAALLRKDETARVAALEEIARLAPHDTGAVLGLAEAELRRRRFGAAADLYRRVLAIDPAHAGALNGLGYAQGESGDLAAGKKTLELYGQRPDQATNALDSLGEIHFMNGKFAAAEKYFQQVSAREPGFLEGAPAMKAAYAHWLGGDLAGADLLMEKYLDLRTKQNDPMVVWRQAVWRYATGRREQAFALLAQAPADQAANMDRQKSVWRGEVHPPDDLAQLKALFENTNPAADGLPRTLYAEALARAGKIEEAKALVKLWPLPDSAGDPMLQSLLYPRFLELRKSLHVQ